MLSVTAEVLLHLCNTDTGEMQTRKCHCSPDNPCCFAAVTLACFALWYHYIYLLPKRDYNRVHPYTSWIPITLWIILRNMTPSMRHFNLSLYGWLGCITLETYISQFHTWLTTGIPNGQPKMLLNFFPANYPLLNFAAATAGEFSCFLTCDLSAC